MEIIRRIKNTTNVQRTLHGQGDNLENRFSKLYILNRDNKVT